MKTKIGAGALVVGLVLAGWWFYQNQQKEQCLEDNGAWNYKTHKCEK